MKTKITMLFLVFVFALSACSVAAPEPTFVPPLQIEGTVVVEKTTRANGYEYLWEVVYKVDADGKIFLLEQMSEPGHSWLVSHGRKCKKTETPAAAVKCMKAAGVIVWTEKDSDGKVEVFHKP